MESGEKAPTQAWLLSTAGWLVPGAGHLLQGKWVRGLLLGAVVWFCFVAGLLMGGHMFTVGSGDQNTSTLLQVAPMIANLGSGILYIFCWLAGVGFQDDPMQAARATFEYGNTFLLIAGLLNYLSMLDAFDISAGRKS
jgi:uncharacterized protein DUF6677